MNGTTAARDGYESYYTEKLWQLVPEVYRHEDGIAAHPGVLRRIVELVGAEAAQSRRSIDRLWEDQHIETCDDWAVPYVGDLVGARLVSALDRRGRRVDVATAVRYRRRRGTPDVLDTLVRAMSGWDVVLVEGFRRLARTRHRLDPRPRPAGFYTGTLPGGTADLRKPVGAEITDGPFDEYFHTLDTRLLRGRDGRYGIRKLNFHLYRLRAYAMTGVEPVELSDPNGLGLPRTFTIDPSGRDMPLFINAEPPDPDSVAALPGVLARPRCGQPYEWEITQAMRCRILGHVAYRATASHIEALRDLPNPPTAPDEDALFHVLGVRIESERALRRRLRDLGAGIADTPPEWYRTLVGLSLIERSGKAHLYPAQLDISIGGQSLPRVEISSAHLADVECHPEPEGGLTRVLISPEQGRFASVPPDEPDFDPFVERYHYGFSADLGAGPYPRDPIPASDLPSRLAASGVVPDGGVLQGDGLLIEDNRTYSLAIRSDTPVDSGILLAGPQRRPYVLLSDGGANLRPQAIGTTFVIDGGWYGVNDPADPPAPDAVADFVIEGVAGAEPQEFDFERVEIRFATFDPGGTRADGGRIPALRLLVSARIRTLVVRRSIIGPIHVVREAPDDPSTVDQLVICESIVDAAHTAERVAVSSHFGTVVIEGSTIFGDVHAAVLKASDSIVDGTVRVVNNQAGCFRFSASEPGEDVRLPARYRDVFAPVSPASFNSTRFGDPQYAQLSIVAPETIARGAENGSEMGVFSHLLTPIRLSSVRAKVSEFGPVGLIAQYLFEGDHAARSVVELGVLNPEPQPGEPPAPPSPGDLIPEGPLPPAPALPTSCPDDTPPEDDLVRPPVVIRVRDAELNGAPLFWRGIGWSRDTFPAPAADGRELEGIPFDRVDVLLEYDARLGTLPVEQGWTPSSDEAARRYELDDEGTLRFNIAGQPAFFTAHAELGEEPPAQVHAYVNILPERISNVLEDSFGGFEQRVDANDPGQRFRGMRAEWVRTTARREFHYVTLNGREILASPVLDEPVRGVWHRLSLQADFREGRTLLGMDGTLDEIALGEFGESRDRAERATLRAVFGSRRERGSVGGRIRNVVVSAPGRFIRAWMRADAPADSPLLHVGFLPPERALGAVRFRVRYGPAPEGEPVAFFPHVAEGTLTLGGASREPGLDLSLDEARAGEALLLILERDSRHRDDTFNGSIRLVGAVLADPSTLLSPRVPAHDGRRARG